MTEKTTKNSSQEDTNQVCAHNLYTIYTYNDPNNINSFIDRKCSLCGKIYREHIIGELNLADLTPQQTINKPAQNLKPSTKTQKAKAPTTKVQAACKPKNK